jgi:hypothetical protein
MDFPYDPQELIVFSLIGVVCGLGKDCLAQFYTCCTISQYGSWPINCIPEGRRYMWLRILWQSITKKCKRKYGLERFLFQDKHLSNQLIFRCFLKKFVFHEICINFLFSGAFSTTYKGGPRLFLAVGVTSTSSARARRSLGMRPAFSPCTVSLFQLNFVLHKMRMF